MTVSGLALDSRGTPTGTDGHYPYTIGMNVQSNVRVSFIHSLLLTSMIDYHMIASVHMI